MKLTILNTSPLSTHTWPSYKRLLSVLLLGLFVLFGLQACGVSERQCETADWYDVGYNDGSNGARAERVNKLAKACGEYDLPIEKQRYLEGRKAGLNEYCTPRGIFYSAERGGPYYGVCSDRPHGALLVEAWTLGRELYYIDQQIWDLEAERSHIRDELYYACRYDRKCVRDYGYTRRYNYSFDRIRFRIIDLRFDRDRIFTRAQSRLENIQREIESSRKTSQNVSSE